MRNIVLLLLTVIVGGCATGSHGSSDAPSANSRWRVVPLDPGSLIAANAAILLDAQTGDTWITSNNADSWTKMNK